MPDISLITMVGDHATSGMVVSAYKASRFGSLPVAYDTAVPGGAADATATSGTGFGGPGQVVLTVPTFEEYWISMPSGGHIAWVESPTPEAALGIAAIPTKTSTANLIAYPAMGSAATLHTLTGGGVVRNLQFTHSIQGQAESGRLQVFVDGETTPSIDAEVGALFGLWDDAFVSAGAVLSTRNMMASITGGGWLGTSSAALKYPIPYTTGCVVKYYNPSLAPTGTIYSSLQYQAGAQPGLTDRWRLRSTGLGYRTPAYGLPADSIELFHIQSAAGVLVWFGMALKGASNYSPLERPWDMYVDGETSASFQGNAEDWWNSGFYYGGQQRFSSPVAMLTAANNSNFTAYGGIDILEMVGGISFTSELRCAHGLTAEIKGGQFVTCNETIGVAALYYQDISVTVAPVPQTAADNFTRADNPTLGSTPVGAKVWTLPNVGSLTIAGIDSNRAYVGNAISGPCAAVIDTGKADNDTSVTLAVIGAIPEYPGILVRYVDFNNFVVLQYDAGAGATSYGLYRKVSGSFTSMVSMPYAPADGDVLRLVTRGTLYTVFINGVQRGQSIDAVPSTSATIVGLSGNAAPGSARYSNFVVV